MFGTFLGRWQHICTFWVRVPDWMAQFPHLVNFEAEKAVKEQWPEYFTDDVRCDLKLWTAFRRSFLHIEPIWKFGTASNGCRVWTVEMG
jgi:hypothetical protein